ncbi:hypothetical protein SAMN02745898_101706 [Streptomyces sp. 136MFCol5.1]|jgi:hypothetical protein|nr:hypothetical protein SAMN02745898_101706 [Streptomyces sp. 136MFCol5.1]
MEEPEIEAAVPDTDPFVIRNVTSVRESPRR